MIHDIMNNKAVNLVYIVFLNMYFKAVYILFYFILFFNLEQISFGQFWNYCLFLFGFDSDLREKI